MQSPAAHHVSQRAEPSQACDAQPELKTFLLRSLKNPAKDFCYGDLNVRPCVCVSVRPSGKWLVGRSSTSNHATSFFISRGDTRRCYGVYCALTDESGQRRVRYKALNGSRILQVFRDTRPDLSFFFARS